MESSARYSYDGDGSERTLLLGISHHLDRGQAAITESPEVYKSRWRSIRVMYLTMILSSISFSICMPSLYPYLRILDSRASTGYLGWVVASYSIGQLVASPFFGAWSNIRSKSREPLIVSVMINLLANILYMYLESIQKHADLCLLIARTFIGFGAGNIAVVRSYVAGATTVFERTPAMANLSAFQAIGFIFGNLLQTALVPLGYPGPVHSRDLHIDMYSATGLFSAFVSLINIVLLVVIFQEHNVVSKSVKKLENDVRVSTSGSNSDVDQAAQQRVKSVDYSAVIPSIFLFFFVLFIFAVFETIVTPLGMDMFAWKKTKATVFVGIMLGCAGLVSIFVFVAIKSLAKLLKERNLLLCGFVICLLGYGSYLPWGHTYPSVQFAVIGKAYRESDSISNHAKNLLSQRHLVNKSEIYTKIHDYIASEDRAGYAKTYLYKGISFKRKRKAIHLLSTYDKTSNGSEGIKHANETDNPALRDKPTEEAVGCPSRYDWCMFTPALSLWQYLLGTLFIAMGYPTCSVMSYTIYSKVLGPKPQGIWMGWLTASGSLARALGPVFVSQVYDAYGPRVTFISVIGIIVLAVIILLAIYKRLVPYESSSYTSLRT